MSRCPFEYKKELSCKKMEKALVSGEYTRGITEYGPTAKSVIKEGHRFALENECIEIIKIRLGGFFVL